jgi:hypothetical protein
MKRKKRVSPGAKGPTGQIRDPAPSYEAEREDLEEASGDRDSSSSRETSFSRIDEEEGEDVTARDERQAS